MRASARAPGKLILFGEHFVVAGEPAIAMAINLFTQADVSDREDARVSIDSATYGYVVFPGETPKPLPPDQVKPGKLLAPIKTAVDATRHLLGTRRGVNVKISSQLPVAVGLGSSASVAAATIAAVAKIFGRDLTNSEISELSTASEQLLHSRPSGIDQTVVTHGGIIRYIRDIGFEKIESDSDFPVIIGNTGVRRSTGEQVRKVTEFRERNPGDFGRMALEIREITARAADALKESDYEQLGELMNQNQSLLERVGVSSAELNNLIQAARSAGALGGKLTGAGGGGCMIAVAREADRRAVAEAIGRAGGIPFGIAKSNGGVTVTSAE